MAELTQPQFTVLVAIAAHWRTQKCAPAVYRIAKLTGIKETVCARAIRNLQEKRMLLGKQLTDRAWAALS